MTAEIVPVGLSSSEVLPGIYTEVNFAQGPSAGAGLPDKILVLCNKLATGSATVDTEVYGPDTRVQLQSEPQMISLAGDGSEAHRLFRVAARLTGGGENGPPIYWLFVTESAGAKATGTITIAHTGGETAATGSATHRLWVGDESVDTGIFADDEAADIATSIAANVNAQTHWPVTAAAVGAVVTITAKQKGLRGNGIRYQAAIISPVSIATTTTRTADTAMSGGTTADSNATALGTIYPQDFTYIVSAADDFDQVDDLVSQVSTKALASTGVRQRVIFGSALPPADAIAVSNTINHARAEMVWSEGNPWTPAELAINSAVIYALEEADELGFRTNFIGYGTDTLTQPLWNVPAPRSATLWPTKAELRSLLQNGGTPIGVTNGVTYLVDRFTTRCMAAPNVPETRIRDAHKVTIADRFARRVEMRIREAGAGKAIADDPPNGVAPPPRTITPGIVKGCVYQTINEFEANAKLQRVAQIRAGTVVQRETNPSSRIGIRVPLQTIDNFRQAAFIVDQVA